MQRLAVVLALLVTGCASGAADEPSATSDPLATTTTVVSPAELAGRSDLVIEGRLVGVDSVEGDDVDRSPVARFRIVVGNTYQGDVLREVTAALGYGRDELGEQYESLLPVRARVVAFLFADPSAPGEYALNQQEGLYVSCRGGDTVDGQGPGWAGIDSVDELIDTAFSY